ncbi:MAG: DNA topoisomerase III [Clostridia bacterium]|nr:DNA topoisomerase III [Clostridia bacterium]
MGKIVVVAEKPSVGRDIARVLGCQTRGQGCLIGQNHIVTWAVGHLVTLEEPDEIDLKWKKWTYDTLPILPDTIPLKVIHASRDQYQVVKKLINDPDTDSLICATDAGREGELIFRYIYEKTKCQKPFQRLWINSMTDEAIHDGFQAIQPGHNYDGLYRSAKCRSEADWLVGMNASRAFTLRYDVLLSVGRVQTPTLAILVRRFKEIENFKPEGFSTLSADFGDYTGTYFHPGLDPDTHLKEHADAEGIAKAVEGKEGRVVSAQTQPKKEPPPQLYDLTTLQRDANKLLGFTADKTLKLAQSLYETHKALTYPRTDSRHLPPDMIPKVVQTLHNLPESYQQYVPGALPGGNLPVTKRTVDASKVTDHHALIPTTKKVNPSSFSADEQKLYDMVARRTIAAFYPAYEYDATKVITEVEGHTFRSNGRVVTQNGWHDVPPLSAPPTKKKKASSDAEEETALPPLAVGDVRTVKKTTIKDDMTKSPSHHTDASLLGSMENAGKEATDEEIQKQMKGSGIGTPATRAAIIERLVKVGYAMRKGKNLIATDKGIQMIDVMPEDITSPELTGKWELALEKITDGSQDADAFMESIRRFSTYLVDYARGEAKQASFPEEDRRGRKRNKTLKGLACPLCGKGNITESPQAFSCSQNKGKTGSGCSFILWKDCLKKGGGPDLTEKLLELLLQNHTVQGSTGTISLAVDQGEVLFTPQGASQPSLRVSYKGRAVVKGLTCPLCGKGNITESSSAFSCSEYRTGNGCHFTIWKDCLTRGGGPVLTEKLLELLMRDRIVQGSTGVIALDASGREITFTPNGASQPAVRRSLEYVKKA